VAGRTDVGTYTVVIRATAAGNGNYNSGYKDITVTVTVGKASNPIAVTASQSWSASFSTSAQTKAITAATGAQGTVTYAINSQPSGNYFSISGSTLTMKASTPAGSYSVVVRATAAGNSNYNSGYKDITMTVTVGKVDAVCPTISDWTGPYDGAQHSINVSGGSGGSIQYRWNSTTEAWRDTKPTASIVGSWKVYVQVKGDSNHNTKDCGYKTVTINKATNPIAVTASQSWSTTFSTSSQSKTITAATNNQGTVTYTIQSQKNSSGTAVNKFSISGTTLTMASTNAGTYTVVIRATAAGNDYYNSGYKDITMTVTVGKATGYINLSTTSGSIAYGTASAACFSISSSHGGTLSVSDNNSTASCTLSGTTVSCSNLGSINAGTTITVTAKSAATTNYKEATKTYSLVVNKANPNIFKTETSKSIYKGRNDTYGLIVDVPGKITSTSNSTGVATVTQASKCSSIGVNEQCVVTVTGISVGNTSISHTFTPTSSNYNVVTTSMPVAILNNAFTVTFAGVNPISTSLDSATVTLAGSAAVPVTASSTLSLATNTNYVVSFDYKCASGSNQFDVDFYPDALPQTNPTATTTLKHMDWITSSSNSNMSSCTLRFFDDFQASNESDITITNIMLSRTSTKTVYYGSAYGELPAPTRSGYSFLGWYTASNDGTLITSSSTVSTTANHTLYARWSKSSSSCFPWTMKLTCSGAYSDLSKTTYYETEYMCNNACANRPSTAFCGCTCSKRTC
jgi:uncharacterized repeat protein (TIGR02543 family)